jgi:hypothetical protein
MSEFSDAFASAFDAAVSVWDESCTIAGEPYPCIIHGFELSENVTPGGAGRARSADGSIILTVTAWEDAKARLAMQGKKTKGIHVTISRGTFRVVNDHDAGINSDTVEIRLGPLT